MCDDITVTAMMHDTAWSLLGLVYASTMQVCPVEVEWVDIVMPRLRGVDVKRLSGGATTQAAIADASVVPAGKRALCVDNRAAPDSQQVMRPAARVMLDCSKPHTNCRA